MAGGTDLVVLRQLVRSVLDGLAGMWTHAEIGVECHRLGLPEPPPVGEYSKCRTRPLRPPVLTTSSQSIMPAESQRVSDAPVWHEAYSAIIL